MKLEKLELKHIKGYLDTGLMIKDIKRNIALITTGAYFNANKDTSFKFMLLNGWGIIDSEECKPILRPLSDLTKEIEVNREKFVPIDKIAIYGSVDYLIEQIITGFIEKIIIDMLYEWHFDIHGLIEKGLAISIHDV